MPKLALRKVSEVPVHHRRSKAVEQQQQLYDNFIREIHSDVGELELGPDEGTRSVKVRLRRASGRVGMPIEIWDVNGRVYFKHQTQRRRDRRQKSA